jgi:hypothetical protein
MLRRIYEIRQFIPVFDRLWTNILIVGFLQVPTTCKAIPSTIFLEHLSLPARSLLVQCGGHVPASGMCGYLCLKLRTSNSRAPDPGRKVAQCRHYNQTDAEETPKCKTICAKSSNRGWCIFLACEETGASQCRNCQSEPPSLQLETSPSSSKTTVGLVSSIFFLVQREDISSHARVCGQRIGLRLLPARRPRSRSTARPQTTNDGKQLLSGRNVVYDTPSMINIAHLLNASTAAITELLPTLSS